MLYKEIQEVMVQYPPDRLISANTNVALNPNLKTINYNKWVGGESNVIWITGVSGSGKTTLARTIAYEHKADWIQLDWVYNNPNDRPDEILRTCNVIFGDDYTKYKDIRRASNKIIRYVKQYANSHKNERFVIEGIQIYYADPDIIKGDPIIVVDYPKSTIMMHRFKRDIITDITQYAKGAVKYYIERGRKHFDKNNEYSPINVLNSFKSGVFESISVDIDELESELHSNATKTIEDIFAARR